MPSKKTDNEEIENKRPSESSEDIIYTKEQEKEETIIERGFYYNKEQSAWYFGDEPYVETRSIDEHSYEEWYLKEGRYIKQDSFDYWYSNVKNKTGNLSNIDVVETANTEKTQPSSNSVIVPQDSTEIKSTSDSVIVPQDSTEILSTNNFYQYLNSIDTVDEDRNKIEMLKIQKEYWQLKLAIEYAEEINIFNETNEEKARIYQQEAENSSLRYDEALKKMFIEDRAEPDISYLEDLLIELTPNENSTEDQYYIYELAKEHLKQLYENRKIEEEN